MSQRPYRVLFLCTGNSARSVLAEATLRAWAGHRFEAFSAGSQPAGRVNPFALERLAAEGIPTTGLRSKSWDEFATADAAPMDLVVTVSDAAASESCPVVFGDFLRVHWGLPDPAAVEGTELEKINAFRDAANYLRRRIEVFAALPLATIDRMSLQSKLKGIGKLEGATDKASND